MGCRFKWTQYRANQFGYSDGDFGGSSMSRDSRDTQSKKYTRRERETIPSIECIIISSWLGYLFYFGLDLNFVLNQNTTVTTGLVDYLRKRERVIDGAGGRKYTQNHRLVESLSLRLHSAIIRNAVVDRQMTRNSGSRARLLCSRTNR